MRTLITVASLIFFLSGQTFASNCLGQCFYNSDSHKEQSQLESSDHSCCADDKQKSAQKRNEHNCTVSHCMLSATFEAPVLMPLTEVKQNLPDLKLAIGINENFQVTSLSSKVLALGHSDSDHASPKVPFYIYFQKLFIPS